MLSSSKWFKVEEALEEAVRDGVFPGVVVAVIVKGAVGYTKACGYLETGSELKVAEDAVFDVASLTKPVCTVASLMSLVQEGGLDIESRISEFFTEDELAPGLGQAKIADVLSHCSGLVAYVPFFKIFMEKRTASVGTAEARSMIFKAARTEQLGYRPTREQVYSDLGFIMLTELVEKITCRSFEDAIKKRVFDPIGMRCSSFVKWKETGADKIFAGRQIVPTEKNPFTGDLARGIVHDENSYCMGGVSGHAGLFTTVADLCIFAAEIMKGWNGKPSVFSRKVCRQFLKRRGTPDNSPWALGWKTPSKDDRSMGDLFPENTVGHLGFTGCSVWLDLAGENGVVLLSNRVNPSRENIKIRQFRPKIHNLIMEAVEER